MSPSPHAIFVFYRRVFYAVFVFWSCLLFAFGVYRLVYTIRPRDNNYINNGKSFYDPSILELCLCALLSLAFSFLMLFVLATRIARQTISRNWFEVTCSAILWLLWLGGASAASSIRSDLNLCIEYLWCRILGAVLAFAWLGWMSLTVQLAVTLFILISTGDWDGHIFERATRPVTVEEDSSYMEQKAGSELNAIPWSYRPGRSRKTESYRLSSFTAFVPWLARSDVTSPRSSTQPTTASPQTRRKSSLATHVFTAPIRVDPQEQVPDLDPSKRV